jgi:hypothetical protein
VEETARQVRRLLQFSRLVTMVLAKVVGVEMVKSGDMPQTFLRKPNRICLQFDIGCERNT